MSTNKLNNKSVSFTQIRVALVFILPLFMLVFFFILLPVMGTLYNSFFQDVGFLEKRFVFFANFRALLVDAGFRQALRFTLLFILVSVPLEIALGLVFAMLMNVATPFRGLVRACILIPWAIPAAVSARAWELIYNYSYGLANYIIALLRLTDKPINWLGTEWGAFGAVVLADVWKTTPFVAIILLAGLQTIPRELYEQAKIDRANAFQIFYGIILPIIRPVMIVALLFRTIDGLRIFDLIYVLTNGGPGGATSSISHYAYKYFLSGDFGYGSTISVALFVVAFALSLVYIKVGRFGAEQT